MSERRHMIALPHLATGALAGLLAVKKFGGNSFKILLVPVSAFVVGLVFHILLDLPAHQEYPGMLSERYAFIVSEILLLAIFLLLLGGRNKLAIIAGMIGASLPDLPKIFTALERYPMIMELQDKFHYFHSSLNINDYTISIQIQIIMALVIMLYVRWKSA